ncbi:MAG: ribose 5-phosphate isomerase B [Bacteroidota bacterium]|nr:ribose 5-phosphate isomerase B [Bacteroidota bacterium]
MIFKTITIGADHAGFEIKEKIRKFLETDLPDVNVTDEGTYSSESVDYPDFAHRVGEKVSRQEVEAGIVICGSGNGVCITANKHKGVRAALCWTREIAELARQHNNANVLCIPARFVSGETVVEMTKAFLTTVFEGGRHAKRTDKIEQ